MLLEISQNSQEKICARVSWPATLLKKRLWHRCFPVNFAKLLWLQLFLGYMLLIKLPASCNYWSNHRSNHQRCSVKIRVLRNFANFTGKHLCQSLSFNKVAGLRPATLLKERLWRRCFPVNFAKFLRASFLQNTFGRLLLCGKTQSLTEGINRGASKVILKFNLKRADLKGPWHCLYSELI